MCYLFSSSQFYLEEAKGRVDYQGYIFPRRRGQIVSDYPFLPFGCWEYRGKERTSSFTKIF